MTINMSNYPTNITDLGGVFSWANTTTGGNFSYFVLISMFVIVFVGNQGDNTATSLSTASFFTLIGATVFGILGLVDPATVFVPLLVLVATFFIKS